MFGYVKSYTPELKVCEYEYYRAAYCGLCRAMGKCTGQCSRMTLSYDFSFLALIRLAISKGAVSFSKRRCIAHPLRKRSMMDENDQLDFCAYAAALLTYHKIADDIADESGAKRFASRLLKPFAANMRRRSIGKGELSSLDATISEHLSALSAFEASGEASVDAPAAIFGELLSEITAFGFEGAEQRIARKIGYHVGRWIYITDALDDFSEDVKKKRYNPFILTYGEKIDDRERALIADALKNELCDVEKAVSLIDFGDDVPRKCIIENVFYLGMPHTVQDVLSGKRDKTEHR